MANENENGSKQGVWIVGTYLGIEEARDWTPRGESKPVHLKPKIGLSVLGEEVAITCKDDEQMLLARQGMVKGQEVQVRVEVWPPFGSQGDATFALPGAITRRSREGNWK